MLCVNDGVIWIELAGERVCLRVADEVVGEGVVKVEFIGEPVC